MRIIYCLIISTFIVLTGLNHLLAKGELIEASGSYIMDSRLDETPASATARAREEAKRNAIEQAGTYIETYSKMVDLNLDQDEVRTVAAQFLKIQEESSHIKVIKDNLLEFTVTIKALVNDNDESVLKAIMQDKQNLEELTRRNTELQKQYDELKHQMEDLRQAVNQNNEYFNAVQALECGNEYYSRGDYIKSLEFYNHAIQLNPQLAEIYNNRGNTYAALGQYEKAIKDLKNASILANDKAEIHNNLGSVYLLLKLYNEAMKEYTTAIKLKPNYTEAYYNRSIIYYYQARYNEALSDVKKALELDENDSAIKDLYNKIVHKLN